jgi:hypothetical protein
MPVSADESVADTEMDIDVEGQGPSSQSSETVPTAPLPLPAPVIVSAPNPPPVTKRGLFSATQGVASLRQTYDDDDNGSPSVSSSSSSGVLNGLTSLTSANPAISGPAPTRDGFFPHYQRDALPPVDIPLPPLRPHSRPSSPRVRGEPTERDSPRGGHVSQPKAPSPAVSSPYDNVPAPVIKAGVGSQAPEPTPTGNVTSNINKLLNDYPAQSPGAPPSSSPYASAAANNNGSGERERHRSGSNSSTRGRGSS